MSQHNRHYALITLVGLTFLVLAPLQAEATSHLALRLCQQTNCTPPAIVRIPPKIESVFVFSNITPGGALILTGSAFGSARGSLTLKLREFNGNAKSESLGVDEWGNTYVGATITPHLTKVKDQQAKLQLKTAAGQLSNEFPVNFRAAREVRLLPPLDHALQPRTCGSDSSFDMCNGFRPDNDDIPSGSGTGPPLSPIWARHCNCAVCGDSSGTDVYEVWLYNGWVLDTMDWHAITSDPDPYEARVWKPSFPEGQSYWKPNIKWRITDGDGVSYTIQLHLRGPIDVPWR